MVEEPTPGAVIVAALMCGNSLPQGDSKYQFAWPRQANLAYRKKPPGLESTNHGSP